MIVVDTFAAARDAMSGTVSLVPTMGYLHEGHLACVAAAGFVVFATASSTDECSTAVVTTWPPTPKIARLSASVPPLVKIISAGAAPRSFATVSRARSTAASARCPARWIDDGLAKSTLKYGVMRSSTRGSSGVLAA